MIRTIHKDKTGVFGDSHRYCNTNGEISLIFPHFATSDMFEIFCIEGDLFYDIERFSTLEESEDRIKELLDDVRESRNDKLNSITQNITY